MTAAARYYARLEPVAFGDSSNGLVLQKLATALMAPREIFEITRDDATHIAWGQALDPDTCPSELLDWLAVFAGVDLPPSALTAAEKRARIKGAAGRYRGTPRALAEEVQVYLTGTKTVYLTLFDPDLWHFTVATKSAETPDTAAVDRAIAAAIPAGMIATRILTAAWSWIVLGPQLVGTRTTVGGVDIYTVGAGTYPTWTDVLAHFTTWTDVINNTPH